MKTTHATEPQTMGKTQKTLFINDEVAQLVQACADKTGTSFTKIIHAAILQFFFDSTQGVDMAWVTAAVSLEKGKVPLADVPIQVFEDYARDLDHKLALRKEKGSVGDRWDNWAQRQIDAAKSDAAVWRTSITLYGGGLEGLIDVATTDITERDSRRLLDPDDDADK